MWYRVRKNWNNGKWDKSQIGAYKSESEAISHCTDNLINDGYKVFDPDGNIIYPIEYHELALQMVEDKVTTIDNLKYWSDVFNSKEPLNVNYVKTIITKYSNYLNNKSNINEMETIEYNGIKILKIPVNKFKIKYIDSSIKNYKNLPITCFNLGYFAGFKTDTNKYFTLPVANLVADIDISNFNSEVKSYLEERPIENNKIYWSCNVNAGNQFRNKNVSTLIINFDNTVKIEKINSINSNHTKYAVSGAPIITNKEIDKSYRSEGWDTSIARPTGHGFLGVKDNKYIYYFTMNTSSKNLFDSGEVYEVIKDFGFINLIKVDGGGSLYYRLDNKMVTGYITRQINNIGDLS